MTYFARGVVAMNLLWLGLDVWRGDYPFCILWAAMVLWLWPNMWEQPDAE